MRLIPIYFLLAYPQIAEDERVFFRESFSDDRLTDRGWYDGDPFVLDDRAHSGDRCVRFSFQTGDTIPTKSRGARRLFEPTESLYVGFRLRLSDDWAWTGRPYGPHLITVMTTENGPYHGPASSHLTLYVEPVDGRLRLAAQDIQNEKAPHGLTQGPLRGGYNAKVYDGAERLFNDGEWHHIEAEFQLNTLDPVNDRPNEDGQVRGWVDGALVVERADVILRSTDFPNMKFNQLLLLPYFHNGVPHNQSLWVDEVVVGAKRPR